MRIEDYEELIQAEAEQVANDLFGANYYDLSLEMQFWVRERAIESLWAEFNETEVASAA